MNKNVLIISILLGCFLESFSQTLDTIYVNENYKEIHQKEFERKINSGLFLIATVRTDTTLLRKIRYREYFGKLDSQKKSQLNKLFYSHHGIDTTKTWLIHHINTLPDISKFRKKSGIVLLDSLGNEFGDIMSIKRFNQVHIKRLRRQNKIDFYKTHKMVRSFDDYKKIAKREKKEYGRIKNLEFLHFYNSNNNYPLEDDEFNWIKDERLIIHKIFNDGNRMYMNLIIFPDGNFYAHSGRAAADRQKKLLKRKYYIVAKENWLKMHKENI